MLKTTGKAGGIPVAFSLLTSFIPEKSKQKIVTESIKAVKTHGPKLLNMVIRFITKR